MGSACCTSADAKKSRKIQPIKIDKSIGRVFLKNELREATGKVKSAQINKKWNERLNKSSLTCSEFKESNPDQFAKMVKKGPPSEHRWEAWKLLIGLTKTETGEPGKVAIDIDQYQQLLTEAGELGDDTTLKQIDVDVPRTFSWHPYFAKDAQRGGLKKLANCLYAYSMYNKEVGYTQGMNYVMAFLLMVSGGVEHEAFWFYVAMADRSEKLHPGISLFYTDGFPLYYQYCEQFDLMFEEHLPELKEHFDELGFSGPIWLQKWFITLFLYSFPLTLCIRFWDNILVEGTIYIFKAIIAVLTYYQKQLLNGDFDTVNALLSEINNDKSHAAGKIISPILKIAKGVSVTLPDVTQSSAHQ